MNVGYEVEKDYIETVEESKNELYEQWYISKPSVRHLLELAGVYESTWNYIKNRHSVSRVVHWKLQNIVGLVGKELETKNKKNLNEKEAYTKAPF